MKWILASLLLGASALAQGLVLPFEGPEGFRLAQAFAQGLSAPPPSAVALVFPDLPWRGSYDLAGGLYTRAGARLAQAATGAEWVLLGRQEAGGLRLILAREGKAQEGIFRTPELAWLWLQGQGLAPRFSPLPSPTLPEARLRALAQGEDPDPLHQSALDLREGRGAGLLEGILPQRLLLLWQGRLPPAYQAFRLLAEGRQGEALSLAEAMRQGNPLERTAAHLVLRILEDEGWKASARALAQAFPELSLAWEEVSFAAFAEGNGEEARDALLQALRLRPDYWLYWTNLGWAHYLTGDLPRALLASERAVRLGPNATAYYNLGLFRAIYGDYLGAKAAYDRALRLDEGDTFPEALEDLVPREEPLPLYFRAYLSERTGLPAEALYRAFLQAHPRHPAAFAARRALARLGEARGGLEVLKLSLIPGDRDARPFRAGEAVFPEVRLFGEPYLPRQELETLLYREGELLAHERKPLGFPPLTTALEETAPAVLLPEPGRYTLEVRYGEARASLPLEVGPESLARRLYALGLEARDLSGRPLLTPEEALGAEGEALLLQRTAEALRAAAPLATGSLFTAPLPRGPYAGRSVQELLREAIPATVRVFLEAVLEAPELLAESDVVNAFVNWLLQDEP
ncbi:tetratricopeptide repeat protein [Thermus thermamylovorans]|uniref:Tetratricopeptide repeat protein n=1 Tax=Thermus thermamylovorans TaxID=2509362 RepID=A0A4Q9B621_9DEIN|nr:tetratricopeptide repeat protein [Thermus thermamylovorans]TBH21392.1 tetratricopeptide repeat protein [Thermus thermamylovorans]